MKTIIKFSTLLGMTLLLLTGCQKSFLDTQPKSSVGEGTATSNVKNLDLIINGVHNYLYNNWYTQGYTGLYSYNIINDMLGEDVINSTTGNNWYISESRWLGNLNPNSNLVYYTYYYFYKIIQNTNSAITNLEKLGDTTNAADAIKGEALAIRAFSYFQLVQRYGKRYEAGKNNDQLGLVLRTESGDFEPKARATVEETYTQINKDLDEAITLLRKQDNPSKNRVNLLTALAFKARVALTQQKWADAVKFAEEAISIAPKYGVALQKGKDLLNGFNSLSNSEWIWGYTQTSDQNMYYGYFFAYMSYNFSSTNIRTNPKVINSALYNTMSATDIRRNWWDPTGKGEIAAMYKPRPANFRATPYNNFKFEAADYGNSSGDIQYLRLPELYLIVAEANAHAGNTAAAQEALNTLVVTRDPAYVKSTATGEALLTEILNNRRIELWGEGYRFLDLKRLNQPLDRTLAPNTNQVVSQKMQVPAGDKLWTFAIPKEEIDASNELVKQNDL